MGSEGVLRLVDRDCFSLLKLGGAKRKQANPL